MSTKKFNTQSGYSLDVNNITSKITLDFNTNVVDPTDAILGTDQSVKEFVLIDQSLLPENGTDGIQNVNLSSINQTHSGSVKQYVFEKLIDPSVVGCENCGDTTTTIGRAKYLQDGVNTQGQVTDISVLPIINKDVIAEIEISAEAYHTFDIDLVGHRKICDDTGNCFDKKENVISFPNLNKNWLQRSFNSNPELLPVFNSLTNFFKPSSDIYNLTAKSFANTTPTSDVSTQFPPYNAPTKMSNESASFDNHVIDYGCCRCCSFYEDFSNGVRFDTIDEVRQACNDTNLYNVSVPNFGNNSGFLDYCTTKNKNYLEYDKDIVTNNVSHCDIIRFKIEQYGSYPNPHLPECLNSSYPTLDIPVPLFGPGIEIPCCCNTNPDGCFDIDPDTGEPITRPCSLELDGCCVNASDDTDCRNCAEDCVGGGGGGICDTNPCDPTCPLNCAACPADSRCTDNPDCSANPCDSRCPQDCATCSADPRCGGGPDCSETPCDPACPLDCGACSSDPRCPNCTTCSGAISCGSNITCVECSTLLASLTTGSGGECDLCANPDLLVAINTCCSCAGLCDSINFCGCCNPLCPEACCDNTTQPSDCDYSDCCGRITFDSSINGDIDGGGIAASCPTETGMNSTIHNSDIETTESGLLPNQFVLGRCKNSIQDTNNIYKVNRPQSCYCVPETVTDTKNYCSLNANTFKNIFDEVSWHLLGGHFYANRNLRDYIYNQEGTVHFTTSVNSNFTAFNENKQTVYHIENIKSNGKKYLLNHSYSILAPAMYNTDNAFLSLGYGYITTKISDDGLSVPKISERFVKKYTYYNRDIQAYLSEYRTNDEFRPINDVRYVTSGSVPSANLTTITPTTTSTFSVASSTNASTELIETGSYISDSSFNEWPLTNSLFEYTTTGRQSFELNTTQVSPINWSGYNNTLYYSTITPTDTVQVVVGTDTERTNTSGFESTTHKKYLINNGIRQDYPLINDARDFSYVESGILNSYENYKFLGRLVDDETIEIPNGNAMVDGSANLISYASNPIKNLSAKILFSIFSQLELDSPTDPKIVTINAYTHTTDLVNSKVNMIQDLEILDDGTLLKSFTAENDLTRISTRDPVTNTIIQGGKIIIKLDRKYTRWKSNGSLRKSPTNFYFMFKVKNVSKAYTDSITHNKQGSGFINYNPSSGLHLREQFTPSFTYLSRTKSSVLYKNEFELFTIDSARFSTPDYASYDATPYSRKSEYDQLVVPMRGLQYQYFKKDPNLNYGVMSEVDDYPIIRTIRKNNGKFYLQILAGAFPYYHLLVHEPVFKKIGILDTVGLAWRNRLCNRESNWYDYVATTKWTCSIKHTEFTTNIPGWKRVEDTSEAGTGTSGKKPVVIGKGTEVTVPISTVPVLPPIEEESEPRTTIL